jgi:catechol 2,3-dioxygenase-like lactoylglutathione lyase family enzyme
MPVKAGYSTPMLHVKKIEKSIAFYEQLGFTVVDTDRCEPLGWARMHCEGGAVMFLRAEEPVDPTVQAFLLYMYTPDLAGLREQLRAAGIGVTPITYPPYMPGGEMRLTDPDGYAILVAHWGETEHTAWLERIGAKRSGATAHCERSGKSSIISFCIESRKRSEYAGP